MVIGSHSISAAEPADESPPPQEAAAEAAPSAVKVGETEAAPAVESVDESEKLLALADEHLEAGEITKALRAYQDIVGNHGSSPAAQIAKRSALVIERVIAARSKPRPSADLIPSNPIVQQTSNSAMVGDDLFSRATGERLAINIWERLDFAGTMFTYGLGNGAALAAGSGCEGGCVAGMMAASGAVFGGASLYYLLNGNVDRGDLPLAMAVTAYLPAAIMFTGFIAEQDSEAQALTTGLVGVAALPIGLALAAATDVDPGDTQLVRDSIFWGSLFGIGSLLAVDEDTGSQTVGICALSGGIVGGLAGTALASFSDPTLERVRVVTWAGYAGTALGLLVGVGLETDQGYAIGAVSGGVLGLTLGAVFSEALDELPSAPTWVAGLSEIRTATPTVLVYRQADGRQGAMPGVELVAGNW